MESLGRFPLRLLAAELLLHSWSSVLLECPSLSSVLELGYLSRSLTEKRKTQVKTRDQLKLSLKQRPALQECRLFVPR